MKSFFRCFIDVALFVTPSVFAVLVLLIPFFLLIAHCESHKKSLRPKSFIGRIDSISFGLYTDLENVRQGKIITVVDIKKPDKFIKTILPEYENEINIEVGKLYIIDLARNSTYDDYVIFSAKLLKAPLVDGANVPIVIEKRK